MKIFTFFSRLNIIRERDETSRPVAEAQAVLAVAKKSLVRRGKWVPTSVRVFNETSASLFDEISASKHWFLFPSSSSTTTSFSFREYSTVRKLFFDFSTKSFLFLIIDDVTDDDVSSPQHFSFPFNSLFCSFFPKQKYFSEKNFDGLLNWKKIISKKFHRNNFEPVN